MMIGLFEIFEIFEISRIQTVLLSVRSVVLRRVIVCRFLGWDSGDDRDSGEEGASGSDQLTSLSHQSTRHAVLRYCNATVYTPVHN